MNYVVRDLTQTPPTIKIWWCPDEKAFVPNPQIHLPHQGIKPGWWLAAMVVSAGMWVGILWLFDIIFRQ